MSHQAVNQRTVVCENPKCSWQGEHRTVSLPLIAGGICLGGPIFCECDPQREMRIVNESD